MFEKSKPYAKACWTWFRQRSVFVQLLLVFPVFCAILLTLTVGSMGLALMGTAIPLHSLLVGWIGGVAVLILGKAGIIVSHNNTGSL